MEKFHTLTNYKCLAVINVVCLRRQIFR